MYIHCSPPCKKPEQNFSELAESYNVLHPCFNEQDFSGIFLCAICNLPWSSVSGQRIVSKNLAHSLSEHGNFFSGHAATMNCLKQISIPGREDVVLAIIGEM
jgi:hypothetical protein